MFLPLIFVMKATILDIRSNYVKQTEMLSRLKFKTRFDDHLSRKFFHMISGSIVALLFVFVFERPTAMIIVFVGSVILITLDFLRLRWGALNNLIFKIFGPLMREDESSNPSAQMFYVLGLSWSVIFLPKPIAVQAILTLAWMDPVAGIVGVRYGRSTWSSIFERLLINYKSVPRSLGAKTVEGSLAGFCAAFVAGVVAWTGPWVQMSSGESLATAQVVSLSAFGAFVAVVAEAWPSQWDDNANIPFWTGLLVWALMIVMQLPVVFG
jgi:dolichol kinase